MKIRNSDDGIVIESESVEEALQFVKLSESACDWSAGMLTLALREGGGFELLISPEPVNCLRRQIHIVDEHLQWMGTGEGRVDRIKELLAKEERLAELDDRPDS